MVSIIVERAIVSSSQTILALLLVKFIEASTIPSLSANTFSLSQIQAAQCIPSITKSTEENPSDVVLIYRCLKLSISKLELSLSTAKGGAILLFPILS